ncbi:MAG: aminotransferase class I/II-fold pyridoxal phosphate-dependent enzyme [Acidimicrobiia bacterium]|nr:aminotransferase class I/II-fold pyridoxal phosphate-dependent enzyme [Acidimicrobiia bacterium]
MPGTDVGKRDHGRALRARDKPGGAGQLAALIEARIAAGELRPGDRLDPVRAVAATLGLAPNTVAAAYRTLGERGFVIGEGRRGTFVATRPPIALPADEQVPPELVDLASGVPDPDLLPALAPALAAISSRHATYGEPAVDAVLGDLLRADLERDGVDAGNLCVVGGALDGIERTLAAHLRPGDRVGVEDPGYPSVTELVGAMSFRAVPVAVDAFGPRPEAVDAAVGRGVAALIVTPRAQNPTGAALDEGRAAELRSLLAEAPHVVVIEDDHAGRVAGRPYRSLVADADRPWATVRSVAKSLGPDLRLAALVGDSRTVQRVAGRQTLGAGWVSHLLQRIVAHLLADPELDSVLERASTVYAHRRAAAVDVLRAGGHDVVGRSGLNLWLPVDDEGSVVAGMQRLGFAVRSGARFRSAAAPGVRLSIAAADVGTVEQAAAAILAVIGSQQGSRSV